MSNGELNAWKVTATYMLSRPARLQLVASHNATVFILSKTVPTWSEGSKKGTSVEPGKRYMAASLGLALELMICTAPNLRGCQPI